MLRRFWQREWAMMRAHTGRRAIGYMLLSTLGFSAMSLFIRMAGHTLDATLIVTLRNVLTLILLLPAVMPNKFAVIRTARLKDHFWRGIVGSVGMITWTYCLTIIPLAHATALSFTAPLLVTLFAILVLKEKAHLHHFISLGVGFLGVLIILRPSVSGFEWNSLLVIFATSAWGVTSVFVKSLSRTEPPLRMVFYMNLFMLLVALPFGAMHWQMPDTGTWFVLLAIACCSILMHFTQVKAYSMAPVVTLMPFDFMRLVYTSILAYLVFGETSDVWTWVGAGIIVAAAVVIARRDTSTRIISAAAAAE